MQAKICIRFCHPKKPEVNKKISSMQDTSIDRELYIFVVQMLKTVSVSFIIISVSLNWSEHFIW